MPMHGSEGRIRWAEFGGMVLLVSAILSLVWSGCGKDESPKLPLDSFIGEWKAHTTEPPLQGSEYYEYDHILVLKADSTFTYHRQTYHGGGTYDDYSAGTFSVQGDRLILSYTEPIETMGRYSYEFTPTSVILTNVVMPGDVKEYVLQP